MTTIADISLQLRNGISVNQSPEAGGLPISRIETIADGTVDSTRVGYAGLSKSDCNGWLLQNGDLLVSHINSTKHLGKCAIYLGEPPELVHGMNLLSLRVNQEVAFPRYVYQMMCAPGFRRQIPRITKHSVNQSSFNISTFKQLEIPLPPLAEQKRIAGILDAADALRAKRREALAQLHQYRGSMFNSLFGKPLSDSRWPIVEVGDVGEVQLGRQRAPKYQTGKHTKPYVRVANVYEDEIDTSDVLSMDFDERDFKTYLLRDEDILLNEGQSTELVGRPAMWQGEIPNCCFQNTLVRFRADKAKVMPAFALEVFLYYLRSGEFAKVSTKTSNVAHLGASRFAKMPFPLPPLGMQSSFSKSVAAVKAQQVRMCAHLAELDALFASLQSRAFRGEL